MEGKIEGRVEVTGRRRKHLRFCFEETTGCRILKEGALDRIVEESLCTRQWTCRKKIYVMNEEILEYYTVCAELCVF